MPERSQMLLNQRLRNRIMDILRIYADAEEWSRLGPDEVINQWGDIVDDQRISTYVEPVFSKSEQEALRKFHQLWKEYCRSTPRFMPSMNVLKESSKWKALQKEASEAYVLFSERGWFREEQSQC